MVNNQKTNFIKKRPLDQSRSKTRNTKDKNTSFTGSIATNQQQNIMMGPTFSSEHNPTQSSH